ncbi:ProQ/FinO family protein [Ottowia testudinis]|uniref:Prop effector n=1 Tax=Ottowia testudinis TaxID=2816950 RepID=A0A975CFB0_9BURK|nr:ProQ/FINO family protein [Ottowia testudinis]QTD45350.1 prop effector [Ottowia testudinis]
MLEQLFTLYPQLFGAHFVPLQRGVFEALLERHPEQLKREDLKIALAQHTRSTRYLLAVASGAPRHDLDGQPVEPVAPEHVHHAIMEVFKRRQARTSDDLRPALRRQLVAAFERSALSASDYLALVQGRDEAANQLVQDALAEAEAQSARRQALQRAYEASGKPVEEFAQMYGMAVREVRRMLLI